ncbi:MAG: twin-arginine translocation signal domain-containing protein [Acidobacteria bacterium]|nr:MAG: twin-arginine translocation signal domain-containing protein [Acidobacteriota bacterium]
MRGGGADGARMTGGVERRDFLKVCTMAAAAVGLPASAGVRMARAAEKGLKPSVIWLHFQECTGCSESLLRTSHPSLARLILDLVSLDYHETLLAAAGVQAEDALHQAMDANDGKYVCVIEGAIPTREGGVFCKIADRTALEIVDEVAARAGAIVAIGSCASWGGIPSADPNPTGARGAPQVLEGRTVVTIPGCPANPYNFLGTVLQYVALGSLPALDEQGRPLFAYGRTIHEHCPRRAHFDAGRFVLEFGDEGHRQGWCLYRTGCKGPQTRANCSTQHFGEEPGAWPIGIGHPCVGCTEQRIAFRVPMHDTVPIDRPTPPDFYPPIEAGGGGATAIGAGVAGLVLGAAAGAGAMAARRLSDAERSTPAEPTRAKDGGEEP